MTDQERTEKEYRAQWIRDAARDLLIAHLRTEGSLEPFYKLPADEVISNLSGWSERIARATWDLYVKERG